MTQIVNPSIDRVADSFLTAGSLAYAGLRDGGIVPSGQQTQLAEQSAADETVLNGFAFSTSGLDVTVSAGEAFVFGSWIIKDTQTTVTLPASSTTKVYVGWNKDAANSVIIGRDSDFDDEDSKIEVGEFTTDSSTVTSESDLREFVSIDAERLEGNETEDITPDISDDGATVVENVDDINVEGFQAFEAFLADDGATIVGPAEYTDSDAISAVNNESSLSVNISGDANSVDGFNFVENGNSASNVINYDSTNEDIDIGGQDIADLSIDGQEVQEVTINGSVTWKRVIEATGGTTVIDRTINGVDYRIHAFENVGSSTFSVNEAPAGTTVDVLIVAGGGGGGDNSQENTGTGAGGGGAGGVVFLDNIQVSGTNNINVGEGGSGSTNVRGDSGGDSFAFGSTAVGGGGGGNRERNTSGPSDGADGGSGGGGGYEGFGGSGTSGQGNDGGNGSEDNPYVAGGGGGAGGSGNAGDDGFNTSSSNGNGGPGIDFSSTFGSSFGENGYFAGGGGGGTEDGGTPGSGGIGGGGSGGSGSANGEHGIDGTGGGGGGSGDESSNRGGDGGSGIVLIRYEI